LLPKEFFNSTHAPSSHTPKAIPSPVTYRRTQLKLVAAISADMAAAVMTAASGRSLLRLTLALAATGLVSSHVVTHRPVRRPELLHVHRRSATVRDVALAPTETPWLTHVIRGAHVAAVAGVVACPAVMDAAAGAVWHGYSALSFTGHPMFEACWAVTVFVLSIAFYESLHMFWPGAVRHRLDGAPPRGAMHGFTRLSHLHKTVVPAASYLGSIFVWHKLRMGRLLFGIPAGGWAAGAPSFVRIAVELLLGVWMYDLLFYPFHLAMHKLRIPKVRRLHSRHHRWAAQEGEGSAHIAVETVQNSCAPLYMPSPTALPNTLTALSRARDCRRLPVAATSTLACRSSSTSACSSSPRSGTSTRSRARCTTSPCRTCCARRTRATTCRLCRTACGPPSSAARRATSSTTSGAASTSTSSSSTSTTPSATRPRRRRGRRRSGRPGVGRPGVGR